ncbi:MAG: restriction endonuclease subunit [Aeromicrobium sp.]|nr:restriction endonuclease subunit [Aeromicrobium sp.]
MSEWREARLGAICSRLSSGSSITSKDIHEVGAVPVFGGNGVRGYAAEPNFSGECAIIGRQGAYCGNVRYFRGRARMSEHAVVACADSDNDTRFLAYLLSTMNLRRLSGQAAQPGLSVKVLAEQSVRLPPVETQRRIASVVGAIDDLVENNRRRVEVLEEMARATYREWFVNFRYPGHEKVARVDTHLGPKPDAWRVTTLGEAARWLSGGTPKTTMAEYWGGGLPWITSGTLTSLLLDRSDRTLTELGAASGTRVVERDTLLFVVRGMSLVKEFRVGIADTRLAFGQDVKALVAAPGVDPLYLALSVITRADEIQRMVELAGHGTGKLSTDRLQAIEVVLPPADVQHRFSESLRPLRELMSSLRLATDQLVCARDLLLPRLVTGHVDVSALDLGVLGEGTVA